MVSLPGAMERRADVIEMSTAEWPTNNTGTPSTLENNSKTAGNKQDQIDMRRLGKTSALKVGSGLTPVHEQDSS